MYTWHHVGTDIIFSLWCFNTAPAAFEQMKHLVGEADQACEPQLQCAVILRNSDNRRSIRFYCLWHSVRVQYWRRSLRRQGELQTPYPRRRIQVQWGADIFAKPIIAWLSCRSLKQNDQMSTDQVSLLCFIQVSCYWSISDFWDF